MKVHINLNTGDGYKSIKFPDGQPHVNIKDILPGSHVRVLCSITSPYKLLELLEISNALERRFCHKTMLIIPYLMGARSDRMMIDGDSIDLEVIAGLINSCKFDKVILYDVHSDAAILLIKNSFSISNKQLVMQYTKPNSILICPDAGASKKIGKYLEWNKNLVDVVYCNKSRDLSNGDITLKVLEPEKCKDRDCVIIDDLCDGGGTFLGIASQIAPKSNILIVTHGIFSKGLEELKKAFTEIITSDSYPHDVNSILKTKDFDLLA